MLFLKHGTKPQRKLRKIELRQREKKLERVLVGNVMMQLVFGMKMQQQKPTLRIVMPPVIIEHILPIWLMERIGMEVLQIKGK